MKKRILSLFMAIIMCLTMLPASLAFAQEDISSFADTTDAQASVAPYSSWALNDLVIGDTYNIYPLSWYQKDMTTPISHGQLSILMYGIRRKLLDTGCVTKNPNTVFQISSHMTVEQVLDAFYSLISGMEFSGDLGLKDKTSKEYMKENGIFTGKNGELSLSEPCSIEQACVFASRLVTCIFDKLNAGSKGFFWVAKSGGNTVYMLGSIHLASSKIYPFSKEIRDAYQSSDALAVELNLFDNNGKNKLAQLGMYTDGTTLKDHVSAETYQKVVDFAGKYGITEAMVNLFKPWYLYINFSSLTYTTTGTQEDASAAASLGIDMNLLTNAILSGKPILEVEGYEYQAKVLDSFSDGLEEYLLNSTIDTVNDISGEKTDGYSDELGMMVDFWRTGDIEAFKEYSSIEDEYPELGDKDTTTGEKALMDEFQLKLFTNRDIGMAEYIDKLLKADGSTTYFVVVGSAHYISDHDVLDILKDKGYEVTQIK